MAQGKARKKVKIGEMYSPIGPAIFPSLIKPDHKFNEEFGDYTARIRLTPEQAAPVREKLTKFLDKAWDTMREEFAGNAKVLKKMARADTLPLKEEEDKEGEPTGYFVIGGKKAAGGRRKDGTTWKTTMKFFDSTGKAIKAPASIFGGSELRLAFDVNAYFVPKDNLVGVSLELVGVQIIKLVQAGERDVSFGAVEGGWTASDDEPREDASTNTAEDAEGDEEEDSTDF